MTWYILVTWLYTRSMGYLAPRSVVVWLWKGFVPSCVITQLVIIMTLIVDLKHNFDQFSPKQHALMCIVLAIRLCKETINLLVDEVPSSMNAYKCMGYIMIATCVMCTMKSMSLKVTCPPWHEFTDVQGCTVITQSVKDVAWRHWDVLASAKQPCNRHRARARCAESVQFVFSFYVPH